MVPIFRGKVWKFGDNVDTGQILPGQYLTLTDPHELAQHAMESIRPGFASLVQPGDLIVAGHNFGTGSSREHAAKALKYAGIAAVLAESIARIFFRNAFNIGMAAIPVKGISSMVTEGDWLEIDLHQGIVINLTTGRYISFAPLPSVMLAILAEGGIIPYTTKLLTQERGINV
ncbi:3-isopropylmalate dehydratase, small subunit [Thermanaeromonas toyohensis ToBE]|uniref:3-isopropylmalate dehydratase small subunit n=1 Tax=Thermanaeromonas toyohensis ToBE TaxID=698762 RepID=A0A1W1VK11_9FIRM|nr:3-isopropylmalate dehydratase small subunit [Thermanaeromonas toyohensis]SMB93623.1 3-isopropylmalate dehydratase, small subunit [Thermanaeromonas toyohensis ToBE]